MAITIRHHLGLSASNEAFLQEWDQLFAHSHNPVFYNDWRWHQLLGALLVETPVYYFVAYDEGELIAIVPLTLTRRHKNGLALRVLGFPHDVVADLCDLVLHKDKADAPILTAVLDYIQRHRLFKWDLLELKQFGERSACFRLLDKQGLEPWGTSAFTRDTGNGLVSPLSKKQVKNVQRHTRHAEQEMGSLRLEQVDAPDQIAAAYEQFLSIEQAGWKGVSGTQSAIRLRPAACAFYQQVLRAFSEQQRAQINLLYFGDAPVAAQMGLRTGNKLCLLKIGYDERVRDFGPGGIALLKCLDAEEAKRSEEVCLVTNPPWAHRWHFETETLWSYRRFNSHLFARLLRVSLALRAWWKARSRTEAAPSPSETATNAAD